MGPHSMVIRDRYYRFLQERALQNNSTPGHELEAIFEAAMYPPDPRPAAMEIALRERGIERPKMTSDLPNVPTTVPNPDPVGDYKKSAAARKKLAAERMAHARSFRKVEQRG